MTRLWDIIVTTFEWLVYRLFDSRFAVAITIVLVGLAAMAEVTDFYYLSMYLQIPRTYDNMSSEGFRRYQRQSFKGVMTVTYDPDDEESLPVIEVTGLTNKTHKINGKEITYSCTVDSDQMFPRFNLLGNNHTCVFKRGSVNFFLDAEPSYSIGEDDEDNSLFVTLAGCGNAISTTDGQIVKSVRGNVAGTLGCGCRAYGHISPTRVNGAYGATALVDDVAAVFGHWSARFRNRTYNEVK